ncbi:hypothetical protein FGIG_09001 [Fasciola gigantica]|uniref:Protein SZT2 n=1 Tax=Fasciola gigantica TaxID=46835 RepID=A0A504YE95_FASGI|nr:hypothetical protein FGIG_09001 [Fasciola gigantica]
MNPSDILTEKLYLVPHRTITVEQLSFWYISHLKHKFIYTSEKGKFHFLCPVSDGHNGMVDFFLHDMVNIVSVLPFDRKQTDVTCIYDSDTIVFCLRLEQKYVIIVDLSSSIFHASNGGDCYLNDALHILESVIRQFAGASHAFLPGTNYCLRRLRFFISIIAVLPNQRCYTLLSGWLVNAGEIPIKIRRISRLLMRIERELLRCSNQATKTKDYSANSLTDLLKHGILTASSLAPNNELCSMLIITDGCLSVSSVEILDRSLTHLRSEGIRCSFILLNSQSPMSSLSEFEGAAVCYLTGMNVCIPQVDLCSLVAHSTSGFCVNTKNSALSITDSYGEWHGFLELLITTRLVCRHDALDGNLNWVPGGTLETQRRLVRASMPFILIARLRDGYKLRHVRVLRNGNHTIPESNDSINKSNTELQVDGTERSSTQCLAHFVQLELTMLWKVGITFIIRIRGLWPDIHRIVELNKIRFGLDDGTPDSTLPSQIRSRLIEGYPANSLLTCHVSFSISANYSFLHEVTCKRKYPIQNVNRASTISRFVMYHRHLSVTDQQVEHIFKFWHFGILSKIAGQLPSGLPSVFTVIPDSSGKLIVVPSLLAHRLNGNPDQTVTIAENKSQFFHFWRLFIERDLLECYRWLHIQNISGILEHDSPLSTNLHLPPEGDRYTASVACRQSLDRLHAFLSHWCTFTLLEDTVYVRILSLGDDEAVHFSSRLTDEPTVVDSQSSVLSSDVNFTGKLPSALSDGVPFFCVVRIELKIPEFRLRIGFVLGTLPQIQDQIIFQLKKQIAALRFLPRGRQAIPKSRHKSGAPLPTNEWNSVPPLQRSWEDIPCCNIFHNCLDRLIVNTGIWSNRLFIGYRSLTPREKLPSNNHSESADRLVDQQFKDFCPLGHVQRPALDLSLLGQHLHHESKIWVIQPTTFSDEALRLLFSSLLNLRFQEGFHLVRVGPQTGFVSLATEISLCSSSNRETETKCLVQYQLYPLGDARLSDTDSACDSLFSTLDIGLKEAITQVIMDQKHKCTPKDSSSRSIFDLVYDTNERLTYPFKFVQLVTELWIQPIEGRVISCPTEIHHWTGSSITELAGHIFAVDQRCVVAYATLERLCTVLRSCVPSCFPSTTVHVATEKSVAHVQLGSILGCLAPEASVEWAQTCLFNLTALSPQLVLLYSFMNSWSSEVFDSHSESKSDANDFLLFQFCDYLMCINEAKEIYLSAKDSEEYTKHLLGQKGLSENKLTSCDQYLQWRCFILPGSTNSETGYGCTAVEDFACNPFLTIIFVPRLFKDASNYAIRKFVAETGTLDYSTNTSFLPVFVYACSRVYLSYLIDDRWTYKVPPTSFFDLRYKKVHDLRQVNASHPIPVGSVLDPPDIFLAVGRQNLRLTQQLNLLWISLNHTIRFVSRVHLDSFIFSVYHSLNRRTPVDDRDLEYVLRNAESCANSKIFSLNLTPLLLLTCEQFSSGLQEWLQQPSTDTCSANNTLSMILSGVKSNLSYPGPMIHIPPCLEGHVMQQACSCGHERFVKFQQIMNHYLFRLERHDGLFILSKTNFNLQTNSAEKCQNEDKLDTPTNIFQGANVKLGLTRSDDSTDNESENITKKENDSQKMEINRKRTVVDTPEDRLSHMVREWFVSSNCSNELEGPVFIKIIGVVTYGAKSVPVLLSDGLPLFCFNQVRNALLELIDINVNVLTSGRVSIDLSLLKFEIQLSVWHWPHRFHSQTVCLPDETVGNNSAVNVPDRKVSSPNSSIKLTDAVKQYSSPLAIEDALETLSSWSKQSELSQLTNFQKSTICQFICRLLWQFQEDIVCSLRAIKPILVPSIEFVLRHIEDTNRLCHTPLFEQCGLLCAENFLVCSDRNYPNYLSKQLGADSIHRKKVVHDVVGTHTKLFVDPLKVIKIDRIPLDFVAFSPETFSYFVRQFEKIFTSSDANLEYYDGYYLLRSTSMRPRIGAADTNRSCTMSGFPRAEVRDSVHTKSDLTCGSLLETILRRRSFDHVCFSARHSRRCRVPNDGNSRLWPTGIKTRSRKFSFPLSHMRENQTHPSDTHMPSSLGYDGDTSDLGELHEEPAAGSCPARIPCQLSTKRANGLRTNSEGSQGKLRFGHLEDSCQLEMPLYWLIFRVCVNSISLFFHHSHSLVVPGYVGHPDETCINPLCDSGKTFSSSNCNAYQFACKSIHAVIKLVNQRILLNKLRNEGICDELLMSKSSDPLKDHTYGRKGIRSMLGDKHFRSPVGRSRGLQSSGCRNRRAQKVLPICSSSGDSSDEETAVPACATRIGRERKNRASISSSSMSRTSPHTGSCSTAAWPPGYFACPVQMVSYLRLHPRILAATTHVSQKDKGCQIVSALRCLLEKPAIVNRPDMFFLIDQASSGSNSEPPTNQPLPADGVSSLDEFPVFYMILKGGTLQSFKIDSIAGLMYEQNRLGTPTATEGASVEVESMDDPQLSGADDSKSVMEATKDTISASFVHLSSRSHSANDLVLQITLHGVDTPSHRLCNFVRQMLQQLLDDLILQHFSDGLSRNAINRLSVDDLSFLSSRQPLVPQQKCLIVLPRFLLNPIMLFPNSTYGSHQLVLAFCHYLRQHLLLFLTAVKLDSTAHNLVGHELMELFLYNRPRAQGVAKPGVATLLFQLTSANLGYEGLLETQPYTITDWTLPCEQIPTTGTVKAVTVEQLKRAFLDVYDYADNDPVALTNSATEIRLVLSVRLWQRGDADINGLKTRVHTAITQSLYDLITEFFVLTSPVKLYVTSDAGGKRTHTTASTDPCGSGPSVQMNPHLTTVVLPWLVEGKRIDSPLVLKTEVPLSSGILMDQFLIDFLNPFSSSLKQCSMVLDGDGSVATRFGQSMTSSPMGAGTPTTLVGSDLCLGEMFFHVFFKENRPIDGYWLKQQQFKNVLSSRSIASRPGVKHEYLVVGRNIAAWRWFVQRVSQSPGCGVGSRELSDRFRSDRYNATDSDVLLRLQSLQVTVQIPVKNPPTRNMDVPATVSDQSVNRSHMDESALISAQRTQTPAPITTSLSGWHLTPGNLTTELIGSGLPAANRFPEFCSVQLTSPRTVPLTVPNTSPRTSATTTVQQQPPPTQTPLSGQQQQQSVSTDLRDAVLSTASDELLVPTVVQVPRQALCMLKFTPRLVTVYTYNWSKEEADRLSYRLTSLADWYNRRLKLLQCLSTQKLGLFHDLNHPFTRWCASHATELIRNPCPPELLTYSDSVLTGITSRGPPVTPISSSNLVGTADRGSASGLRASGSGVGSAAGGGSGGSGTRRRHPTSSGNDFGHQTVPPTGVSLHLYSNSSSSCSGGTFMPGSGPFNDLSSVKNLSTFLRLFQAETALTNEPVSKQLKRFSAIRLACRHLHTICTPILFCPQVRAQAVQIMQSESAVLNRVAEACFRCFQESAAEATVDRKVDSKSVDKTQTAKSSVSSADQPSSSKLRELVSNLPMHTPGVHRAQSCVVGPTPNDLAQLSVPRSRISLAGLHSASPWLHWSRNPFTELAGSQTRTIPAGAEDLLTATITGNLDPVTLSGWERRVCAAFLAQYAQYLQSEVGFRPVLSGPAGTSQTGIIITGGGAQTMKRNGNNKNCSYFLFHRAIHLAGVHIMEVIRMDRTTRGLDHGQGPLNNTPSYTFGILVQHLVDPLRSSVTRQSSHPELKGSKPSSTTPHLLLQSKSLIPPKFVLEGDSDGDEAERPTFPSLPHSVTACVVVDERKATAGLFTPGNTVVVPAPGSELNVIIYLIVTNPSKPFPKSRLTSAQECSHSRLRFPVEWPGVAPRLEPGALFSAQPGQLTTQACNIDDAEVLAAMSVAFSGLLQNRHASFTFSPSECKNREQSYGTDIVPVSVDLRWQVTYLGMWPSHHLRVQRTVEAARAAIEQQITRLVSHSSLDCHKNLLWYRLFDMHHYLDSKQSSFMVSNNEIRGTTTEEECPLTITEHQLLSIKEIDDLVRSAPFQLDILTLDTRLRELVEVGACHFVQTSELLNTEFAHGQVEAQSQPQKSTGQVTNQSVAFTCLFRQTPDPNETVDTVWFKHYMVLLSPTFTEGFVLLSWLERAITGEASSVKDRMFRRDPKHNYRDFQFRAVFRTAGDPMNPGSMRRLLDSGHHNQSLFFERSPLAALVTHFMETLSFCIWRSLAHR